MNSPTTLPATYRSLLQVRGLPRLVVAAMLGRIGGQMASVALVLFALERFHSPAVAGITVFASAFPGIVVSPLAGAILDRSGRIKLIMLDYAVAALAMALIVALGAAGVLSAALLVGVAALSSFTNPLSGAGTRTLFPISCRATSGTGPTPWTASATSSPRWSVLPWPGPSPAWWGGRQP